MNAHTDTTPDPIRDGRAHDLAAWEEYWDTHGYAPVGLDDSQASDKAVELSRKASMLLERERLGLQDAHAPIEMRRWGEEVCVAADAPNGSQCVIWLDVAGTDPDDLEAIVAENLLCVLLQCLFSRLISIFPQCGRMVFPGLVIMQSVM